MSRLWSRPAVFQHYRTTFGEFGGVVNNNGWLLLRQCMLEFLFCKIYLVVKPTRFTTMIRAVGRRQLPGFIYCMLLSTQGGGIRDNIRGSFGEVMDVHFSLLT